MSKRLLDNLVMSLHEQDEYKYLDRINQCVDKAKDLNVPYYAPVNERELKARATDAFGTALSILDEDVVRKLPVKQAKRPPGKFDGKMLLALEHEIANTVARYDHAQCGQQSAKDIIEILELKLATLMLEDPKSDDIKHTVREINFLLGRIAHFAEIIDEAIASAFELAAALLFLL